VVKASFLSHQNIFTSQPNMAISYPAGSWRQGRPCSVGSRGSRPGPPNGRGPLVMYACSVCVLVCVRRTIVCIYEGSNCDMLSAQRKANNLRPTHLPFFLAKPPRGTPACSVVLHKKKRNACSPPRLLLSSSCDRLSAVCTTPQPHPNRRSPCSLTLSRLISPKALMPEGR